MGLLRSAGIVSFFTFVSRIFGLARDVTLGVVFGPGAKLDAFWVAFKLPNFMRRLFAEGAFSQAFVPVLGEYKVKKGEAEVRELVSRTAGSLAFILFLITLLGVLVFPWLIVEFGSKWVDNTSKMELTASMLVITFPYIFFISLTALAGGVLNTYGRFAVPAFTPVFLNLCLIGAAVFLAPTYPPEKSVMALAWGVFIAGVVQLAFQLPFLYRLGFLPCLRIDFKHEGVRKIMSLMGPAIIGSAVVQINLVIDLIIAMVLLPDGSVSWLTFSDRLVEFPLGVFGIAIASVILPQLSSHHAETNPGQFSNVLDWGLRWTVLIGLPATVGLMLLSGPLLVTMFNYGAFSNQDILLSQMSMYAYASGLLAFILIKVLTPGFYSRQDTKTPVRIAIWAMALNLVLNFAFVLPWLAWELEGPHTGLALATSLAAMMNAAILLKLLKRQGVYKARSGWAKLLFQVVVGVLAMAVLIVFAVPDINSWFAWSAWQRIAFILLSVGGGGLVFLLGLFGAGFRLRHVQALRPGLSDEAAAKK